MPKAAEGVPKEGFEDGDTAGWALRGDGEGTLTAEQNSDMAGSWVGLIETAQPDPGNKGKSVTAYREFDGTLSAGMTLQALVSFTQRQPGHVPQIRYVNSAGIGSGQRNQFRLRFDPPANNVWCQVERGENVNRNDFATANAPNTVYKVVFTLHSDSVGCELFDSSGDRLAATTVKHPPEFTYNTIDRVEVQNRESVDIRFDEISRPAQGSGTTAPDQPETSTTRNRLADAILVDTYLIEGNKYYVYADIPNEPSDRLAFTDTNGELLEPNPAMDVAFTHTFTGSYAFDARNRLGYTNEQHGRFERVEDIARLSELTALVGGAIALSQLDPLSSLTTTVEAVQAAVDWGQAELDNPYEEQYAKMAASSNTVTWAAQEVGDPEGSLLSFSENALEVGQVMLDAAGQVDAATDIAQSASTVSSVIQEADSITDSVSVGQVDGIDDLRSASYTAVTSWAVDATIDVLVNVAEIHTKQGALGAGSAGARQPLLNTVIDLESRLRNRELGPMGIFRLQVLRQTDYQLEANAWHGLATLEEELSSSPLGPAWDVLYNVDDLADGFRSTAEAAGNLSLVTMAGTGREMSRALDRYEASLNAEEYGDQQLFHRP